MTTSQNYLIVRTSRWYWPNPGEGSSYHVTSLYDSSVQLSFFGTGISLYDMASCAYDVTLDGTQKISSSPPFNTLFNDYGLNEGVHSVTLIAQPFNEGQTLYDTSGPNPLRIDDQNTFVIASQGNWTIRQDSEVPTRENPTPFFLTQSGGASASMSFNGKAVEVRGINTWRWWDSVTLDEKTVSGINASSFWIIPDAVLFFQYGLNETLTHSLSITNSVGGGMNLALNSIALYQFRKSSSTSISSSASSSSSAGAGQDNSESLSAGQTAEVFVGTFISAALITFAAFWLCIRRLRFQTDPAFHRANVLSFSRKSQKRRQIWIATVPRAR
ncbi:hypothetical protein ACEPAG_488 [Sanghuangporus baumii]